MTGLVDLSALQWLLLNFGKTSDMTSTIKLDEQTKRIKYFIHNFEARSVVLIAAMTFGGIAGAQGQTTAPAPSAGASAAADSIPANRPSNRDVDAAFDQADTNKDGKLSRTEAETLPSVAQRFELIDTDRDTFISREELTKFSGS